MLLFVSSCLQNFFFLLQGENFYLFFETKNSKTLQGDIGVAMSNDQGATWQPLGIVLDEEWHLSYPYVFTENNQVTSISSNTNYLYCFKLCPTCVL